MRPPFRVASIAYICYTFPGQLSSPKTETANQPARRPLMLWYHWWNLVCELRSACARTRTFLWMSLCLAGFSTRKDLLGVTSIVRALGLEPACYDRLQAQGAHDAGDAQQIFASGESCQAEGHPQEGPGPGAGGPQFAHQIPPVAPEHERPPCRLARRLGFRA